MTLEHGFVVTEKFQDSVNFPYGFRKSGDFSISEADILQNIGHRLFTLEQGMVEPANHVEKEFIKFCNESDEPNTKVERTWAKYKRLTSSRKFHSLNGSSKAQKVKDSNSYPEDDY